jgi:hypothetical protein
MSRPIQPPPAELDSANVLAYAVVDETVEYTGRITLYVDGKLVDPVPRLVIAHNQHVPHDYLLFHCNSEWEVLGAGGYASLAEAERSAEIAYAGISKKWQHVA